LKLNDLYIQIKNNKIVLYSKKFKKEVIPMLSNAHNYGGSSLSIYHFLASIQSQYFKPIYSFSWQNVTSHYNYFPRVCYQNIILKKAFWTIETLELETFKINKKGFFILDCKFKENFKLFEMVYSFIFLGNKLIFFYIFLDD
jgi:hypothetical protein